MSGAANHQKPSAPKPIWLEKALAGSGGSNRQNGGVPTGEIDAGDRIYRWGAGTQAQLQCKAIGVSHVFGKAIVGIGWSGLKGCCGGNGAGGMSCRTRTSPSRAVTRVVDLL